MQAHPEQGGMACSRSVAWRRGDSRKAPERSAAVLRRHCRLERVSAGAMALFLLVSIALAQETGDPGKDAIRVGGEWINISDALPLSSPEISARGWQGGAVDNGVTPTVGGTLLEGLSNIWGSLRRGLWGSTDSTAQWYIAVTDDAHIGRLESSSDVAIGMNANVGVHVMTGTASAARRLAADAQVPGHPRTRAAHTTHTTVPYPIPYPLPPAPYPLPPTPCPLPPTPYPPNPDPPPARAPA
jgi:hypothetical protein